jgi:hypothetical protein
VLHSTNPFTTPPARHLSRRSLVRAAGALLAVAGFTATSVAGAQVGTTRVASAGPVAPAARAASAAIDWSASAPFPAAVDHHVTFVTSGTRGDWLHVLGGHASGRFHGNGYQARIGRDGALAAWEKTEGLPAARAGMAFATDARIVLLIGGRSSAEDVMRDVYIAPVWGDGRLGAFKAAPFALPAPRVHTAAVMHGEWVYVIGGNDGAAATASVLRARYSRTSGLGAWTEATALPGARSHQSAFVHAGAIYVVGGVSGESQPVGEVLRATIEKDGTLGAWQVVSKLDAKFATHASVVKDGYLYVIGGVEDAARTSEGVLRAPLAKDGTIGAWEATASPLPAARAHVQQVPVLRDFLFSVGGTRGGQALDEVVVGKFNN